MKKASLVIKEIQEGSYNDILKVVYIDENRIEKQPQRYVEAIEKFISLYGDQEIEIYSTPGRSEVSGNHTDHQNGEVLAAAIQVNHSGIYQEELLSQLLQCFCRCLLKHLDLYENP